MKKLFYICTLLILLFFLRAIPVSAQEEAALATEAADQVVIENFVTKQTYDLGNVLAVIEEQVFEVDGTTVYTQKLRVKNQETDEISEVMVGNEFQPILEGQRFKVGDKVILTTQTDAENNEFTVLVDMFRIPILLFVTLAFFLLVAAVGGIRGILSIIGMLSTFLVLGGYMLPAILSGSSPIVVSVIASVMVGFMTIYLAHGFNRKSHIAFGAIVAVLLVVVVLSSLVVSASHLLGLGDEESYFLQFANYGNINLQGLFLAGIIIGALGVLDDIVIAQVSVVEQLLAVQKKISKQELYFRALEVGKDHVASLVNTLVLAYAGTSLPLFLLFFVNTDIPAWVKINDQIIAEEVVRTLTGSIGLVMAVPVTTLLAVYFLYAEHIKKVAKSGMIKGHSH